MRTFLMALALALAGALFGAAPAQAASIDYVALGDSYSAGTGAPFATGTCARSAQAFPQLWANANRPASFAFPACGGATTDTLLATQLGSLSAATDLVSVTIGGNDVGFANTVLTCQLSTDAACQRAIDSGLATATTTLPGKLTNTYQQIRNRAPNAKVVVLGYARLFEENTCLGGLSLTKRRAMNAAADQLDDGIKQLAEAAGFTFADVRSAFAGHGICSATPWINDFSVLNTVGGFHPNANGNRLGYLPVLTAAAAG